MKTSLFLAVIFLWSACSSSKPEVDYSSGGDHRRDLARLLPLNNYVQDFIRAGKGDHTDWKYIVVPGSGKLDVLIEWESKQIKGYIEMKDPYGMHLERLTTAETGNTQKITKKVLPGKYFIKIHSRFGDSAYSITAYFEPERKIAKLPPLVVDEPKNEPLLVPTTPKYTQPVYPKYTQPVRTNFPVKKVDKKKDDKPKIEYMTVMILRVTPNGIMVAIGSSHIGVGSTGAIVGATGCSATISQIYSQSRAFATTNCAYEKISNKTAVSFPVKK